MFRLNLTQGGEVMSPDSMGDCPSRERRLPTENTKKNTPYSKPSLHSRENRVKSVESIGESGAELSLNIMKS